jgi:hypothetical protein
MNGRPRHNSFCRKKGIADSVTVFRRRIDQSLRFSSVTCQLIGGKEVTSDIEKQLSWPYRTHSYPAETLIMKFGSCRDFPPLFLQRGKAQELAEVGAGPKAPMGRRLRVWQFTLKEIGYGQQ